MDENPYSAPQATPTSDKRDESDEPWWDNPRWFVVFLMVILLIAVLLTLVMDIGLRFVVSG